MNEGIFLGCFKPINDQNCRMHDFIPPDIVSSIRSLNFDSFKPASQIIDLKLFQAAMNEQRAQGFYEIHSGPCYIQSFDYRSEISHLSKEIFDRVDSIKNLSFRIEIIKSAISSLKKRKEALFEKSPKKKARRRRSELSLLFKVNTYLT